MKAIVFSTRKNERDVILKAIAGKHEITWQSAPLSLDTVHLAAGYQVVIVFANDEVSCSVISKLSDLGIKYVLTRSAGTDHIDFQSAATHKMVITNIPNSSPYAVAEHAVALSLALSRHLLLAVQNSRAYDFSLGQLTGFNIHGKTVGIIGLGRIGSVTGKLFHGFGCKVIGYDTNPNARSPEIENVELSELMKLSDIISLHVPLTPSTFHLITSESIASMKNGVMLINTARGALVKTTDILDALDTGKIGYFGADVYEFEKGLFFEDHETDQVRDALLNRLMDHPNVIVTPHQAFLTVEALSDVAAQIAKVLDQWEKQLEKTF